MKLGERFKTWLSVKEKSIFKVSEVEQLAKKLDDCKENYDKVSNNYFKLKGKVKALESEKLEQQELIDRILKDSKLCKENGLMDDIEILFTQKKRLESDIIANDNQIKQYNKLIETYNTSRVAIKKEIDEIEVVLEQCRAQEQLTKATNELVQTVKGADGTDSIKDLKREVSANYNASEIKLQQFADENKVTTGRLDDLKYNSELDDFINQL